MTLAASPLLPAVPLPRPSTTAAAPSSSATEVRRSVVLSGISWSLYQSLLAEIPNGGVRLTFDHGWLEIMTLSPLHERVKTIIGRLVEAYSDHIGIDAEGLGSTTFGREDLERGLEPDECYYIANLKAVMGKNRLDLLIDPPPDLAVEVDISPPDVAKQPIYAALGIPEVWRYDGQHLTYLHRTGAGYVETEKSLAFPDLPVERLNEFLALGLGSTQAAAARAMRSWLSSRNEK